MKPVHKIKETVEHSPIILPLGWDKVNMNSWVNKRTGLAVILTVEEHSIGGNWLHVSVSRQTRIPTYQDMCLVKELFIGRESKAIQIFAPESEHVNHNPNVLHLWARIEGNSLPDFRIEGTL